MQGFYLPNRQSTDSTIEPVRYRATTSLRPPFHGLTIVLSGEEDIPTLVADDAVQELQFASIKALYHNEIISLSELLNSHDAAKRFLEIEERTAGITLRDKYTAMDDASRPELIEIIEQLRMRIESGRMMEGEFEKMDDIWARKGADVRDRICPLSQVDTDDLEMIGMHHLFLILGRLLEILRQYRTGLKESLEYYMLL
jgi:hypothetical protein